MPDRRDAFVAAAEVALAVESAAKSTGAVDTVATVGICEVFPERVNSIPSRVRMTADVRDIELARRDAVLATIQNDSTAIAAAQWRDGALRILNADAPAQSSPPVLDALRGRARSCSLLTTAW